jgi:hypothetical protein
MSNAQVTRDVLDELLWDDTIDASSITVTADDGRVVLGGTVDYFHEKWNAGEDARRISGVRDVVNEIAVDTAEGKVLDDDLSLSAHAALDVNSWFPTARSGSTCPTAGGRCRATCTTTTSARPPST